MPDLYACRLPVAGDGDGWFDKAVEAVGHELELRAGVAISGDDGSASPAPGSVVRWHLAQAPGVTDRGWTVWWDVSRVDAGDTTALTIVVGLDRGRTWVIVRLGVIPRGDRMGRLRFDVEPPPIVSALVESLPVEEDGWQLVAEPWFAPDRDAADGLAELVLDSRRVLPVIVASSARSRAGDTGPLVDADALARSLVGIAHVAVLDSTSASFALTDRLGPQLSVFGGAVRLYWPGVEPASPPREHPLWLPQLIEGRGSLFRRMVLGHLVPVAVARFSGAALDACIRAAADRDRRMELERLWARAKDASLAPEWQEELERAYQEVEHLRAEVQDLAAQLSTAQENMRTMVSHWGVTTESDDAGDDAAAAEAEEAPTSVLEAVQWAASRCPHLVILDEAEASARRAAYRQPGRILKALLALEDATSAWERGELDGGFQGALARQGFDYGRSLSPSTVGRFPHEYERTYDGQRITLGPHLRLGRGSPEACCRIYLYFDEMRRRCVVGHVGNHLSDSTTG